MRTKLAASIMSLEQGFSVSNKDGSTAWELRHASICGCVDMSKFPPLRGVEQRSARQALASRYSWFGWHYHSSRKLWKMGFCM